MERSWPGHVGIVDADDSWRLSEESGVGNVGNNPGGLIGVWAEEIRAIRFLTRCNAKKSSELVAREFHRAFLELGTTRRISVLRLIFWKERIGRV